MTTLEKSNGVFSIIESHLQVIYLFRCITPETITYLTDKVLFLKRLINECDFDESSAVISRVYRNYKEAEDIVEEIHKDILKGSLEKYAYPI